jgi:hypothetical protein
MDRAVVYTQAEKLSAIHCELKWQFNIPFESVDCYLLEQLQDRTFSYFQWRRWAKLLDEMPTYWNLGLLKNNSVYGFCYGTINPVERELEIKRATLDERYQSFKGGLLNEAFELIKDYAKHKGMMVVYLLTDKAKAYKRKFPDNIRQTNITLLEVV